MNNIKNSNPSVSLISSTYDPSRQIIKSPQPQPQQQPQQHKTTSQQPQQHKTTSQPQQHKTTSQQLHPQQQSKTKIPILANANANANANTNQSSEKVIKISDKIYNHFKAKYPTTIDASGFNKTTIITIVNHALKKESIADNSLSIIIDKIINVIDMKFKMSINSDNRQGIQYDTTTFSMDTNSLISVDKYLEKYTNKVSILSNNNDSSKAIEANLPKQMAPVSELIILTPPEPFSEDFPIRDRIKQTDMMIPEVREYSYYIVINSNDRNIIKYKDPNYFIIDFAPAPDGSSPQTGYIDRTFSNIKSCELLTVVMLDTSEQNDSSNANDASFPYLMLQFDELQYNYYGTNTNLSKTFALLTEYVKRGKYKYYSVFGDASSNTISKIYNPRINLSKLTTRILLPDGSPFNFGSAFTNDTSNSCITFGFRITTIQKNLGTNFMNNA